MKLGILRLEPPKHSSGLCRGLDVTHLGGSRVTIDTKGTVPHKLSLEQLDILIEYLKNVRDGVTPSVIVPHEEDNTSTD